MPDITLLYGCLLGALLVDPAVRGRNQKEAQKSAELRGAGQCLLGNHEGITKQRPKGYMDNYRTPKPHNPKTTTLNA